MTNTRNTETRLGRTRVIVATLLLALIASSALAAPVAGQDESPAPSLTPAEAACSSADDLRVIVDFIRESVGSDSGVVPVAIGAIAGLSEARTLAGLVGETYRPPVEDLVLSLQGLRDTIGALGDLDTAGAKVAVIGEAVVDIGTAMDVLAVQLRTGCPEE